jgi:hypothetical protein
MAKLGERTRVGQQQANAILAQRHLMKVQEQNRGEEEGGFLDAGQAALVQKTVELLDELLHPDRRPAEGPARPQRRGSSGVGPAPQG